MLVVHAVPDTSESSRSGVIEESFRDYVGHGMAERWGLYRLDGLDQAGARVVARAAEEWASKAVPFDFGFNGADETALYCTELVWRAFRRAGFELAPQWGAARARDTHALLTVSAILGDKRLRTIVRGLNQ